MAEPTPPSTPTPSSIVLVGMMGAGKSAVGRRLARRLDWELFDSDRQVEALTGRTVPEIWRSDGEAAFRLLERQVLADALASTTPKVVAAAGGVVLDEENRRILRQHRPVVWLRAPIETLIVRVRKGEGRPLLDGDPAAAMRRLDAVRRPLYAEVADLIVDVDNDHTADHVTERVVRELGLSRIAS